MIVVTGGTGQLGTEFRRLLGDRAVYPGRDRLDLARPETVFGAVLELRPTLVINCAAYTAVDAAETDAATAARVNGDSVGQLARACAETGAGFVTFSTDYVFDGTKAAPYVESDPPAPINRYGATKLEGEELALTHHPGALVVRTSWVLSGTHPNFAATMLRLVAARPVDVVDDQRGHPTLVADLAPAVLDAVEAGATGIVHLTNAGVVTWFELARAVTEIAGLDPERVRPCRTEDFPRPAPRPRNSVLESERLARLRIPAMPHFRPSLERAVRSLVAAFGP